MKKRSDRAAAPPPPRTRLPEDLFEKAFQHSPAMQSVVRAADGVLIEVNETFLSKLGFARAEVVGRSPLELGFWVDPEELAAYRAEIAAQGFVRGREVRLQARDGRLLSVLLSTHPADIDGARHFLSAGVDITLRKETEAKLRESEACIRALYESISAAVVVHDATGFIQINPASLGLFGAKSAAEILGRTPADFSPPVQPDGEPSAVAAQRHIAQAMATGSTRFEWRARRLDGTEVPVEVTLTALQLEGRPVLQAVVIDLTERKRAEEELQRTLARERELNQLKSDFVSLVSHEFRTPLEVIMSSADNLERYHDRLPAEKRAHLLRTIHRSVARMSDMMEEVLLLGRLESGATSFRPSTVDVASFCQRLCDEMTVATGARCPVCVRLGPGITGASGRGDEAVLRHIFTNLISNAVKYSEPGRTVELAVRRAGDDVIFEVRDRGCGIPEEDRGRLFQAFHRGGNVRHIPGTGLGLVIVRRSVALHGGTVGLESAVGEGSTFTVRLPLFAGAQHP